MGLWKSLVTGVRSLFEDDAPAHSLSPEEFRALFKTRYSSFSRLLEANNKALEIMSDLEEALRGSRVFGMSFARASCTAVSVNVFKLTQMLMELAPGRYDQLLERFQAIQQEINALLSHRRELPGEALVLPFSAIDKFFSDQTGGKMANIGEISSRVGLPVPDGFVITARAYAAFLAYNDLQAEIDAKLLGLDETRIDACYALSSEIQQRVIRAEVPPDLAEAIREQYGRMCERAGGTVRVSFRSSALGEDASGATFAGQFRSLLNVAPDSFLEAYKEVVASKYSLHAMTYRLNRGINDEDVAMCVGCMTMIDATSSGVMYSRNPLSLRDDSISINAVFGLPKTVVDGTVPTDLFVVERSQPLRLRERQIRVKAEECLMGQDEGVRMVELDPERGRASSLDQAMVLILADMAVRLEDHYGQPQDIEWALDRQGRLFLLQCRPLQQMDAGDKAFLPDPVPLAGQTPLFAGGTTASPGVACGPIFVARKEADALRFPQGAVLVIAQALPRWATLLNRAAALITEQGGVTGHLANVAREFEVPALFEVPGATTMLPEGVLVTVDAEGRCVYPGRVEELLAQVSKKKNIMQGSPVYETLQAVGRHILPLSLLDPASAEFKPANCRTFHDITRFAHEKSVQEMFELGENLGFSGQAGKQLVCKVPMQWWVINLDDGFSREIADKWVYLTDIVSDPMLALWNGVTAIPWAGPPVTAKGLMSVFLQASMNPELESTGNGFSERNVFMISKNYCCLNSRFGFHFTTVEALLSDSSYESYISFKFSGGAADETRRARRSELIAEVLENHDFICKVREDNLFARAESREKKDILDRLRIIGYLLMHTRQMDMAMSGPGAVASFKEKLLNDIASLLSGNVPSQAAP